MASEYSELVGSVGTVNSFETDVWRRADGTVTVFSAREAVYDAARLARLRELLDRAAMPGQEEARAWPCCVHCTRGPCAGHPYACADGCNGAEGGRG